MFEWTPTDRKESAVRLRPLGGFPARLLQRGAAVGPGVSVCAVIALGAVGVGSLLPVVGSALPAILAGLIIGLVRPPRMRFKPGVAYSAGFVLQLSVALLGTQLSLATIAAVGVQSLPVMLSSLTVCLLAASLLGRALGVEPRMRTLLGVGTGICGASAIAAVSPLIAATSAEIAYAISALFLFNIVAVVGFPVLGRLLQLDPHAFGLLAGTAVNDTSSVVAAAGIFGSAALGYAVVVKLTRTLMLIPISVGIAALDRRHATGTAISASGLVRLVPWFLVGFLLTATVNSTGVVPSGLRHGALSVSTFLIATALAGVGLSTDLPALRAAGLRPLVLAGVLWLAVAITSIMVILLTDPLR